VAYSWSELVVQIDADPASHGGATGAGQQYSDGAVVATEVASRRSRSMSARAVQKECEHSST